MNDQEEEVTVEPDKTIYIPVLAVGDKVCYNIPSFPVFDVMMRYMKYQYTDEQKAVHILDGLMRDAPSHDTVKCPSLVAVPNGSSLMLKKQRSRLIFELSEGRIFVIWKWSWCDSFSVVPDSDGVDDDEEEVPVDDEDTCTTEVPETPLVEDTEEREPISHSVVFKCIGVTRDPHLQAVIRKNYKSVDVELIREPTNPVDSLAVAFMCTLENKKEKLGYVALDAVHVAIASGEIIGANVAWARFLIHWSRSGPGWYAGILVTKNW